MAIVQNIDLNLIPDSEAVVVKVNQYDDGTGRINAHLYLNDTAYMPASGATVRIEGTKPDKHGFSYTASISGNTVTANLTTQMTAVAGRTRAQIIVEEPSGKTGTFAFWLDVQAAALADDTDISETEIPAIMDLARENARKAEEAAENAETSAEGAAQSAEDAEDSASAAAQSASDASSAASTASTKAGEAAASATSAAGSATAASGSATTASDYATQAKSWAVGPSGTGTSGTDTNNSKYWADQAAQSASEAEQYAQGGLIYRGSILFANIPTTNLKAGDMYNIEDDFTTDSRFQEGAGFSVKAGTNIAWNGTKWDLLAVDGGGEIQVVTMPTASADNVGDIVQFTGTTTGSYTNGYFYKCVENSGSYSWVQTDVQPSSGGGGASESEIAPVETTTTASKAYAVDDLFIYDGKLYRVTAAISSGGTITPNTNCVETSVSEVFVRKTGDTMTGSLETTALTVGSRASGYSIGTNSVAEGTGIRASGPYSHGEGYASVASGHYSHAEGSGSQATGECSHAEGATGKASGIASHAEGFYTVAGYNYQHAQGKYNDNKSTSAFEIGNGASTSNRSNALEVTWDGDVIASGDITDGQGNSLKGSNSNLAPIEPTTTASQAYGVGDYLVYGGQLYKVTAAIASGGTIVPTGSGANVVATTVILVINDMVGLALTASY